jgi:hypothetical protein
MDNPSFGCDQEIVGIVDYRNLEMYTYLICKTSIKCVFNIYLQLLFGMFFHSDKYLVNYTHLGDHIKWSLNFFNLNGN